MCVFVCVFVCVCVCCLVFVFFCVFVFGECFLFLLCFGGERDIILFVGDLSPRGPTLSVPVAKWITRLPPKEKIAGSIPARDVSFVGLVCVVAPPCKKAFFFFFLLFSSFFCVVVFCFWFCFWFCVVVCFFFKTIFFIIFFRSLLFCVRRRVCVLFCLFLLGPLPWVIGLGV